MAIRIMRADAFALATSLALVMCSSGTPATTRGPDASTIANGGQGASGSGGKRVGTSRKMP
jgi:hypothetical protein